MMDRQRVQELIPHRDPFLFIDRVTELDPDEISIVAEKIISKGEPYLDGHFPGNPIMPGVLIVEALAQTGLICLFELKLIDPRRRIFLHGYRAGQIQASGCPGRFVATARKTPEKQTDHMEI